MVQRSNLQLQRTGFIHYDLIAFLFSDNPKLKRIGEAHLSYYTSAYNWVETNQPPQDLLISSM